MKIPLSDISTRFIRGFGIQLTDILMKELKEHVINS